MAKRSSRPWLRPIGNTHQLAECVKGANQNRSFGRPISYLKANATEVLALGIKECRQTAF